MSKLGIVVIGRNEGLRLERCLKSLPSVPTVYVDSGSRDSSVSLARSLGHPVLELDSTKSFSAARARDEGFRFLQTQHPDLDSIQFLDGDCEIDSTWLKFAQNALDKDSSLGVVFGSRRELFPEKSLYNLLCDLEWQGPSGPAESCGGDSLFRSRAYVEAGGFNPLFVAGEEGDLCSRVRQLRYKIERLNLPMSAHDANLTSFSAWWRRSRRAGLAYALAANHYPRPFRYPYWRASASIWFWTLGIASGTALSMCFWGPWFLGPGCGLVAGIISKTSLSRRRTHHNSHKESWLYGVFCWIAKFPQLLGQVQYFIDFRIRKKGRLVEYK